VCAPAADVAGVADVTVSLPRLVGRAGVTETFPLPLSADEQAKLRASAAVIRQALDELGRDP
jgi:L-lactate dehydrogenase